MGGMFLMQILAMMFNVFAISLIQQKTPGGMLGKIMAYVGAICMCAQPLGQVFYGFLFSGEPAAPILIFSLSGLACCGIALASKSTFRELEEPAGTTV